MPLSPDSVVSLFYDVPLGVSSGLTPISERGHGASLRPKDIPLQQITQLRVIPDRAFILQSLQENTGWQTTTTGLYARRRLTDFSPYKADGVTAGGWEETQTHASGDYWLCTTDTGGKLVSSGANWSGGSLGFFRVNPHIHLSAFLHGVQNTNAPILLIVFGGKFTLSVAGNGYATITDDSISEVVAAGYLFKPGTGITHRYVHFSIRPLLRRTLFVFAGDNTLQYEDTSKDQSVDYTSPYVLSGALVPSSTVTIQANVRAHIQPTEVVYNSSGSLLTAAMPLPYKPGAVPTFTRQGGSLIHRLDTPGTSAVAVTAPAFTPATDQTLQLQAAFSPPADQLSTPVLYSPGYRFAPTRVARPGSETDITAEMLPDTTLQVDDDGARLILHVKNHLEYRTANNRVVLLKVDGDEEFRGFATNPEYDDSLAWAAVADVRFTVEDEWAYLNSFLLPSSAAYDGMYLTDGIKDVLTLCGYDSTRWDIAASTFVLPDKGATGTDGNATGLVQPGQGVTAGQLLREWQDRYTNLKMVFTPVGGVIKFQLKDLSTIGTPAVTLYSNKADADVAMKDERWFEQVGQWRRLPPEATQVHVYGQDAAGGYIHAQYGGSSDPAHPAPNEDPTLADGARPTNWVGYPKLLIAIVPSLNTQALCNAAAAFIAQRTIYAIDTGTVKAEWHPEAHRGDTMRIDATDFLVKSYTVEMTRTVNINGRQLRPATYRLERVVAP